MSAARRFMFAILDKLEKQNGQGYEMISGLDSAVSTEYREAYGKAPVLREAIWMVLVRRAIVPKPKLELAALFEAATAAGAREEAPPPMLEELKVQLAFEARITAAGGLLRDALEHEEAAEQRRAAARRTIDRAMSDYGIYSFNARKQGYAVPDGPLLVFGVVGGPVVGVVAYDCDQDGRTNYDVLRIRPVGARPNGPEVMRLPLADLPWVSTPELFAQTEMEVPQ